MVHICLHICFVLMINHLTFIKSSFFIVLPKTRLYCQNCYIAHSCFFYGFKLIRITINLPSICNKNKSYFTKKTSRLRFYQAISITCVIIINSNLNQPQVIFNITRQMLNYCANVKRCKSFSINISITLYLYVQLSLYIIQTPMLHSQLFIH